MANIYTVKLPDGNEYGPVDRETLRSWQEEGRIGPETWVWPEGSPEWLTLLDVLAGAGESPAHEGPLRLKPSDSNPGGLPAVSPRGPHQQAAATTAAVRPATRRTARVTTTASRSPAFPGRRGLIVAAVVVPLLAAAVAALVLWLPRFEKQRAGQRIQVDALADRRFADAAAGLSLTVPDGWFLLRPDSTLLVAPQARAKLAHPAFGAFAILVLEAQPPGVMTLDAFLDRTVDGRRALFSDFKELGRRDTRVGDLPARRLTASWTEDRTPQQVAVLAVQDGWNYAALAAWGPAATGPALAAELETLGRGFALSGLLSARVSEAVESLGPENPELSRPALELLVRDRLGSGGSPEEVADEAVRTISQGLPALTREETRELQQILSQVYDSMSESDRQRLAVYQRQVKAGQKVATEEAQALRQLLRDRFLALPEDHRSRLQALNEKAIAASFALSARTAASP
jgi:hypothetical protein